MPAGNFLAYLTGGNGIPRKIPMIDPTTGLPIEEPVITSAAAGSTMEPPAPSAMPAIPQPVMEQAPPPAPVPEAPMTNVMQAAGPQNLLEGTPYSDVPMPQAGQQAPMIQPPMQQAQMADAP